MAELRELSKRHYLAPGSGHRRTFSVTTLERWYYDYKHGGLEALKPVRRSDRGRCRNLTAEQRCQRSSRSAGFWTGRLMA
jgi:hypothetical protein